MFYHTHPHTHFPHFPFANFHIFSLTLLYALVIELQTNIVWWCRYFIRNLMCTPAAVIRNIKNIYIILYVCTACCLLNEGAFFSGFSFWVFCVLWGWNILMSVFLFALYIFVLLLLFTVLWIYCEYIFNTISFGWLWYKFSYQKLLCRSFLNNRALPFFIYIYFSF